MAAESPTHDLAQTVQEISERASLLVREEIELAKAEVTDKVTKLIKGAVVGIVAGVFAVFAPASHAAGPWLLAGRADEARAHLRHAVTVAERAPSSMRAPLLGQALAKAGKLLGQHLVDDRRELVGAAADMAGYEIGLADLGAAVDRLQGPGERRRHRFALERTQGGGEAQLCAWHGEDDPAMFDASVRPADRPTTGR